MIQHISKLLPSPVQYVSGLIVSRASKFSIQSAILSLLQVQDSSLHLSKQVLSWEVDHYIPLTSSPNFRDLVDHVMLSQKPYPAWPNSRASRSLIHDQNARPPSPLEFLQDVLPFTSSYGCFHLHFGFQPSKPSSLFTSSCITMFKTLIACPPPSWLVSRIFSARAHLILRNIANCKAAILLLASFEAWIPMRLW